MAQGVKTPAARPDDKSLLPGTRTAERSNSFTLLSYLHIWTEEPVPTHKHTHAFHLCL